MLSSWRPDNPRRSHTHFTTLIDSFYRQLFTVENGKDVKFKHHQPSQGIASVSSECFRQREVAPSIKNIDGSSSTDFGVSSLSALHVERLLSVVCKSSILSRWFSVLFTQQVTTSLHHPPHWTEIAAHWSGCSFNQLSNLSNHHTLLPDLVQLQLKSDKRRNQPQVPTLTKPTTVVRRLRPKVDSRLPTSGWVTCTREWAWEELAECQIWDKPSSEFFVGIGQR